MLGDAGLAEARRLDQIASRALAGPEQVEDLAAAGLGDGFKQRHAEIFRYRYITVKVFLLAGANRLWPRYRES
jgi:hypothetical protein